VGNHRDGPRWDRFGRFGPRALASRDTVVVPAPTSPDPDRRTPSGRRLTPAERIAALVAAGFVAAGLVLTVGPLLGPGGDDATGASSPTSSGAGADGVAARSGDDRVFPGGRTLAEYRTDDPASYRWRAAVLDREDELMGQLDALGLDPSPADLGDAAYEHLVATCQDLSDGVDAQRAMATRWGGEDRPLKAKTAGEVVQVVARTVCPRLAPV